MVSHFGEVIFPSSRAFWDDEDEYEPTDNTEHSLWVKIMMSTDCLSFTYYCYAWNDSKMIKILGNYTFAGWKINQNVYKSSSY